MKAIQVRGEGDEARLELGEVPAPEPGNGELRIDVVSAAVNRGDLMQRRGLYPPPPGASTVIGLECAGRVEAIGPGTTGFAVGDPVMALLPGGGYAEQATAHAGSVMRVPDSISLLDAGAVPEVFLTCQVTLFDLGRVAKDETVLVQGGGSGIGTAAIQMLKVAGARVVVTAGSDAKCARCLDLGADVALNYNEGDLAERVLAATDAAGVDVVLDHIGGAYLAAHLKALRRGGRLLLIGLMGGARADLNLGLVLSKHLQIIGSTLRPRPVEQKAAIVDGFRTRFGPHLDSGRIRPIVDRVLPLADAQAAHDIVDASEHFGKVVLQVRN